MKEIVNIIFFPTIESHIDNFIPVIDEIEEEYSRNFSCQVLYVPSLITRKFSLKGVNNNNKKTVEGKWSEVGKNINVFFSNFNEGLLILGNDSGKFTKKIIRIARKNNFKIILLQDGLLNSDYINKAIRRNYSWSFTYYAKSILAHNYSPFKNYMGGFMGQNSDYFFLYSEEAKEEFIKAGICQSKIRVTGSPRHFILRDNKKKRKNPPKNFVYFSTPAINSNDSASMRNMLFEIIQQLKSNYEDFKLIIKNHPRESIEYFNLISENNVQIYQGTIGELLETIEIDVALSYNSTVILELLVKNIPVIQLLPKTRSITDCSYFNFLKTLESTNKLKSAIDHVILKSESKNRYSKFLADLDTNHNSVKAVVSEFSNLN